MNSVFSGYGNARVVTTEIVSLLLLQELLVAAGDGEAGTGSSPHPTQDAAAEGATGEGKPPGQVCTLGVSGSSHLEPIFNE